MEQLEILGRIKQSVKKAIIGKDDVIDLMLISLICSGHLLIEDIPGLGKTTMVAALARSLGCSFKRIQFTPDVLPSDITGFNMYNMKTGEKDFQPGCVMNHIILADEINRTTPKTQSALLEVMQERQVTVEGTTYKIKRPFMVLATQNPIDMAGTYPLPEAQLDRFLMKISMGYPDEKEEAEIIASHRSSEASEEITPVASVDDITSLQDKLAEIYCDPAIYRYIVSITAATRSSEGVLVGASPRGSIALLQAACGHAMLCGREFCTPDDVKAMAKYVLCHRLIMKNRTGIRGITAEEAITNIIEAIPVPKVK